MAKSLVPVVEELHGHLSSAAQVLWDLSHKVKKVVPKLKAVVVKAKPKGKGRKKR